MSWARYQTASKVSTGSGLALRVSSSIEIVWAFASDARTGVGAVVRPTMAPSAKSAMAAMVNFVMTPLLLLSGRYGRALNAKSHSQTEEVKFVPLVNRILVSSY